MFEMQRDLSAQDAAIPSQSAFGAFDFFQFDPNPATRLEVRIAKLGRVDLHWVESTGHEVGLSVLGSITALLPQSGGIKVKAGGDGSTARPGEILLLDAGSRVTQVVPGRAGRFVGRVVVVPETALAGGAGHGPDARAMRNRPRIRKLSPRSGDAATEALVSYLSYLFHQGESATSPFHQRNVRCTAGALLTDLFAPVVTPADGGMDKPVGSRIAKRLVKAAEEIMEARCADPLMIADIGAALDVSPRTLQLAFREQRDMTPLQALAGFRMRRARERLLSPGRHETVTDIALDCGFTHLSRFAGAYRVNFGERPSETLGRGRTVAGR